LKNLPINKQDIAKTAVENGIRKYILSRRDKVDSFVEDNYSFASAVELNKKAFGWDMLKTPANILWTPPYFLLSSAGKLTEKLTDKKFGASLSQLPAGFETDVEKEVTWRIYTQLLELPYEAKNREFGGNRLLAMILEEEGLSEVFEESLAALAQLAGDKEGQDKLAEKLSAYVDSRKAAAELSAAMISMAAGFVANKTLNFGAMGLGSIVASGLAHHAAVSSFVLGNTLGSLYYSVFSVTASKTAVAVSTGGVAIILGVISSYTGMLTDPLQKSLGLHQKKLNKLIDGLEAQLLSEDESSVSFRDGYAARVLDLADVLLSLAK